jgi:hypothetical protein
MRKALSFLSSRKLFPYFVPSLLKIFHRGRGFFFEGKYLELQILGENQSSLDDLLLFLILNLDLVAGNVCGCERRSDSSRDG